MVSKLVWYGVTDSDEPRASKEIPIELLDLLSNKENVVTLKSRLRKWGIHPYSGAAIFSAMLPETFYYRQKGIFIVDGVLVFGRLKKSSVGASHRSIIQDIYSQFGVNETVDFFTDAPWILNKWIMERGFSVGLHDMISLQINKETHVEEDKNQLILKRELANVYNQMETLSVKLKDPIEEEFRLKQLTNLSNVVTGIGIRLADDVLSKDNSIGVMTEKGAGTKGAVANIGQMMGAVGQQFLYGKRIHPSINDKKIHENSCIFIPRLYVHNVSYS
jgi:DNA-directed RNA polymerase beta' subunit